MQGARHAMSLVERSGSELVFLCDEADCGRRLVIDARDARLVVIDPGDRTALHDGDALVEQRRELTRASGHGRVAVPTDVGLWGCS